MACANVTNLLLARGESRRGEMAIRTALGASPARLAGELLTEGFVLAVAGGVLGLGLATTVPRAIRAVAPDAFPRLSQASIDARVGGFMVVLGLVTMAVFSAVPMLERSRVRAPSMSLTGRGRQRTRRSARAGQLLTVVQTAMATTVVVMSLTLDDALTRLQRVSLGVVTTDVTTARLTRPPVSETNIAAPEFYDQVLRTVQALPGVSGASVITQLPLSGTMLGSTFIHAQHPTAMRVDVDLRGISASYFDVLEIRRVRGRAFSAADTADSPPVAIVDEAFARRLQPDGAVLGSRIRWIRQPSVDIEIVGVVASVHHRGPAGTVRETVYRPLTQYPRGAMFLAVKTEPQAVLATATLEAAVRSVDPGQPVADVQTMDARLAALLGGARLSTTVAETLAAMAVGLAGVGLYGLLSFGTALRFREFGIRLALGDTPAGVRRLVMGHGLALTVAGVLIGTAGAAVGAVWAGSLLSGTVLEVRTSVVGGAIVLGCSALAFAIPAWRASKVDPAITLRAE
jgi:predicted permease